MVMDKEFSEQEDGIKKEKVIEVFNAGHKEFEGLLSKLSDKQIESVPVVGVWTEREVIAHLAAWHWEQADEITRVLRNEPTWNQPSYDVYDDDRFNKIQVEKRKNKSTKDLIQEWEESFDFLIERIKKLSDGEWNHKCEGQFWDNGKLVTVQSLFPDEAKRTSDEGRHAAEIKEHFNL